jgi:ABC-type uncharacterized transport system permease subunit
MIRELAIQAIWAIALCALGQLLFARGRRRAVIQGG